MKILHVAVEISFISGFILAFVTKIDHALVFGLMMVLQPQWRFRIILTEWTMIEDSLMLCLPVPSDHT